MKRFYEEKPDKLLLLGDILYHGPRNDLPKGYAPKKVVEMLNSIKESARDLYLCSVEERRRVGITFNVIEHG